MSYYKKEDYVKRLDRFSLGVDEISDYQKVFLDRLNKKLFEVEKHVKKEVMKQIKSGDAKISDPNDWIEDYEIQCFIYFILREDDPDYDKDDDNVLVQFLECSKHGHWDWGIGDGNNHNEFQYAKRHPMYEENHCWLYHSLYDHTDLGWVNILRIGSIWVDINIEYQKIIELTDGDT